MVMQYKPKSGGKWQKYPGKDKIEKSPSNYKFRLLSEDKKKVLEEGSYEKVLKRMRQIEYFKRK